MKKKLNKEEKTELVALKMPSSLLKQVDDAAKRNNQNRSEYIRFAILKEITGC